MSESSDPQPTLASDAERERCVTMLRDAVTAGRLTLEEFTDRVALADAARTDRELAELGRDLPTAPVVPLTRAAAVEEHRALCSHLTRNGPWWLPPRSVWRALFGTIELDLRHAHVVGPETVLEVYNLFGTVKVLVPEGVQVVVRGRGRFASRKIHTPERPPVAGAPRLIIDTRGPGGTLHVRPKPARSASLREAVRG